MVRLALAVSLALAGLTAPSAFAEEPDVDALRQAVERLEAADAPAAERAEAHGALGAALRARGASFEALQYLEQAVALRGDAEDLVTYAEVLLQVGRDHMASGRSLQVAPYLTDAVDFAGRVEGGGAPGARAQAVIGTAYYLQSRFEDAAATFGAMDASALPPASSEATRRIHADVLYRLERYDEAAAVWRALGDLRGVASAWAAAKDGEKALAAYGELLADAPCDAAVLADALRAARYLGEEARLETMLGSMEASDCEDASALWLTRGHLAAARDAPEEALEALARAAEATEDASPLLAAGRIAMGQVAAGGGAVWRKRAIDLWIRALERDPHGEEAWGILWNLAGSEYAAAWRSEAARTASLRIQQALAAARPEDGLARANLGNTLRIAGRHEEALAAYDRALEVEPEDPAIWSDRGLVLSALGRPDEALAAYLHAAEMDPDFEAARQNAARSLWLQGDDDRAAARLAEALEIARQLDKGARRYRFLLDRIVRTKHDPSWR